MGQPVIDFGGVDVWRGCSRYAAPVSEQRGSAVLVFCSAAQGVRESTRAAFERIDVDSSGLLDRQELRMLNFVVRYRLPRFGCCFCM